jgi:riboflavin kinase/FMN adenylyltransferase
MLVFRKLSDFATNCRPAVTVGVFDGVHKGHLELLKELNNKAVENNCQSVVVTFDPHPRMVIPRHSEVKLLQTLDEKLQRFEKAGIDMVMIIPFDKQMAALTPHDFIQNILYNQLHVSYVVTGYDHFFGQNRQGDFDLLSQMGKQLGFGVTEMQMIQQQGNAINSSAIRKALTDGNLQSACNMLGYCYPITGKVVTGNKIGRNIGFPTANIKPVDENKLIPGQGVYAVWVKAENKFYKGMLNIGYRPTIDANHLTIEVNIFDFDSDIYDQEITVYFVERIRNEKRFGGLEELRQQLDVDRQTAQLLLAGYSHLDELLS